jgi:excisionase family DNA binding protein
VDEREYWDLYQTAEYLDERPSTIRKWIDARTFINGVRMGEVFRFRRAEVVRWKERNLEE